MSASNTFDKTPIFVVDCYTLWLQGLTADYLGFFTQQKEVCESALYCSDDSIPLLKIRARFRQD